MKRQKQKQTCYLYLRVSTVMQLEGYSIDAQRDRLMKEAKHRGYKVIAEYVDEGRSGKSIKGRPEFTRMLDDIRTAKVEDRPFYVYVFKLSRFGRNAADTLSSLQFLEDYGVNLLCVEDGIDSAGPAGKLLIAVYSAVAEAEREAIHIQTMAGRWQKAREGGWNGGFAPYGYQLIDGKLTIAEDEADLIRKIFEIYTENSDVGVNTVAKRLNEKGYRKKIRHNAKTDYISVAFVKAVLDNPTYAGLISYGRRRTEKIDGTRNETHVIRQKEFEVFEGQHEAIISKEMWQIVRAKREETGYQRVKTHSLEHAHLLSGILKCPECGAGMYANVNRKKKKDGSGYYKDNWYYVCKHRRMVSGQKCNFGKYVRQEEVNGEVLAIIQQIFNRNNVNERLARDVLAEEFDVELLQDELKQLSTQFKNINAKKNKLLSKMACLDADDPLYDDLYDNYTGLIRNFLSEIADIEVQMNDVRNKIDSNGIQVASVERLSQRISEMWNRLDTLDESYVKNFLRDFIEKVEILEEPDILDGVKYWVRSIQFKVPFAAGTPDEHDTLEVHHEFQPNENHVETVVLLSRKAD